MPPFTEAFWVLYYPPDDFLGPKVCHLAAKPIAIIRRDKVGGLILFMGGMAGPARKLLGHFGPEKGGGVRGGVLRGEVKLSSFTTAP